MITYFNLVLTAQLGNAKEKKIENQNYKLYISIIHEYKDSKNKKGIDTAKSNKIDLLSKEMNLNHEILMFKDVDINTSKINMRMMLRGEKIIKKYKFINFNLNELNKNIKEKKIMDFPYKSKLVFNYNLTNDKNTVSLFIKDAKLNREFKRTKSIFETNEDDDENCEEESEDSQHEKKDSDKDIKQIQKNTEKIIENKNIDKNEKTANIEKNLTFRQRLSIFEKQGNIPKNNTMNKPQIKNENLNKQNNEKKKDFQLKLQQYENQNMLIINGIKRNQTIKLNNNQYNELHNIKKSVNNTKKNDPMKIDNINEIENVKINKENEKKIDKDINGKKELKNSYINNDSSDINKNNITPNITTDNSNKLKSKILKEQNENINSNKTNENEISDKITENKYEQVLTGKKIDISKEKNNDSFCNSFFVCSFPYKNGKILENSKNYRSICNHPMCGKLVSMEPEILFKYPPNDIKDLDLNNLSSSICFPTGIKICYNQERRNIYKSFYTHIINQQGQKYYMVIYHFYRKLDSMNYNQLYFDNPLKLYLRQFGDNTFCNNNEKEELEKELLECQELGFRDFVFIPYAMVLVSRYPYINQMKTCLNIIYKIMSSEENISKTYSGNKNTILIKELLSYLMYSIPIPKINTEISFNVPLISEKIKLLSPYKDRISDLENINFPFIISKFCPENIIKIFQLILFEQKILFINKDINLISTVIDSFISILYPIDWGNTIIPIMSSPMVRYLQTFLPFINGISEDLLENSANQALEEAEEGVFKIFIYNDTIKYSKPDYEEDVISSIPNLPDDIYKKLYSELSDLAEVYNNLKDDEKEKYAENVNNMAKNIFFETTCIMLYDLVDLILDKPKEFNGFSNVTLNKIYQKDAIFYKELTESQNFQNFITSFTKREKDYTLFFCMLKNITEKYVLSDLADIKGKNKWKKITRKITKKEVQKYPISFKIPFHLLNPEKITSYDINHQDWIDINNELVQNNQGDRNILQNKFVPESERTSTNIIEINDELKKFKKEIIRYSIPKSLDEQKIRHSVSMHLSNKQIFGMLQEKNDKSKEPNMQNSLEEKLKNDFSTLINLIITNKSEEGGMNLFAKDKSKLEETSNYIYYDNGKEILSNSLYKKGFRAVLKLKEENYFWLNKICTNALKSLVDSEENLINLEFGVKITSSAFYYSKENSNDFLIDDLRNDLGINYYFWNKESFWNTWQIMENYFSLNDYSTYCRIIMHDFSNKLLKIQLDKNFIISYLVSSLGEKMILMEHNNELSQKEIKENQAIFMENRNVVIEIINNYPY